MKRVVFVALMSVFLIGQRCTPGGGCPDAGISWVQNPTHGQIYVWDGAGQSGMPDVDWRYLRSDGTLVVSEPNDPIGFAMSMIHGSDRSDDLQYAIIWALQYDIPNEWTCAMDIDWEVSAQVDFPTGYLFVNEGDADLSVEFFSFDDVRGSLDFGTTDPREINERLHREHEDASESGDSSRFYQWTETRNSAGPVNVSHTLKGEFTTRPDPQNTSAASRIFLAASIAIRKENGGRACYGCRRPIRTLLEAGIFRGFMPGSEEIFGPAYTLVPNRPRATGAASCPP